MLINQITNLFEKNSDLKVLFLFDPDYQFENEFKSLELDGVRCVKVDSNYFFIKHKIHSEWMHEKVFLYFNIPSPHKTGRYLEFPLLDLLEANKEIVTDDEEAFLEEFGLARSQKNLIKKYMKELQFITIQEVCRPILTPDKLDEPTLQQGLIAAFLKFSKTTSWPNIIAKILLLAKPDKEAEWNRFYKKVIEMGLLSVLRNRFKFYFGIEPEELSQEKLKELLQKIRYNQITHLISEPLKTDPYSKLKIKEITVWTNVLQIIQESSRHPQVNGKLKEVIDWAGENIKGEKIIELYSMDVEYGHLTDDMAWVILYAQIENIDFNPQSVIQKLNNILTVHDLGFEVRNSASFLIQLATMISKINAVSKYTLNNPDEYIREYTSSWSIIDRTYRRATRKYRELSPDPNLFDADKLYQVLNKRYDNFIEKVNREWLTCLSEFGFDYTSLSCPKQYEFFKREIEGSSVKTVVIISDALRYEAAEELVGLLHGDDKNIAEIGYQLASIPSKTNVGMAQLLPGKNKLFNQGKITIEGVSTDGIDKRQQILKLFDEEALAVQFSAIQGMSIQESREVFKAPLVYVYHDVIDATGDKRASERRTFKAVDDALEELMKFTNKLHHTFNVTRVFITSDHGFLYNDLEIEEKDKEPGSGLDTIDSHNRYEILDTPVKPKLGFCVSLKSTTVFKDEEDLFVLTPESTNRYKKQGVGHQFVHGGASLQELVVPVINSYRKSLAVAKKVKAIITNESQLKVVSNILRVNILQEKRVSRTEKELEVSVGLYKDNELVSNEVFLELNSTAESPTERMHKFELVVNSTASKETFLKLKVYDVEERLNPLIELRVNNQTLIQPDF